MQDLSNLAKDSMWVTSQAGGNMMSGRDAAMSAPGSQPVDPLPPAKDQGQPKVEVADKPVSVTSPEKAPRAGNPYPKTTSPKWVRAGDVASDGLDDYPGGLHA